MKYLVPRFIESLKILEAYEYPRPFHLHLKAWFRGSKKFGSKDRKALSTLCYDYWRLRRILSNQSTGQALFSSIWLQDRMSSEDSGRLEEYNPSLPDIALGERLTYLLGQGEFADSPAYPAELLQNEYVALNLAENLFYQPHVWLRVDADKQSDLLSLGFEKYEKLERAMFGAQVQVPDHRSIQVQDLSSQLILEQVKVTKGMKVWDCCSGSGGKSIPLIVKGSHFLLSDARASMVQNARKRLKYYRKHASFEQIDLSKQVDTKGAFDLIIADVPCSGSGTWFRNPEHFSCFDYRTLDEYQSAQRQIVKHSLPSLKAGGQYLYITCSVFEKENRVQKDWMEQELGLSLIQEQSLCGIEDGADSMYMALFTKP